MDFLVLAKKSSANDATNKLLKYILTRATDLPTGQVREARNQMSAVVYDSAKVQARG